MGKISIFRSSKGTSSSRITQLLTLLVASSVLLGMVAFEASAAENVAPGTTQLLSQASAAPNESTTPTTLVSHAVKNSTKRESLPSTPSPFLNGTLNTSKSTNLPFAS